MPTPCLSRPLATSLTFAAALADYAAYARPSAPTPGTIEIVANGILGNLEVAGSDASVTCRAADPSSDGSNTRILRLQGVAIAGGLAGGAKDWTLVLERESGPACQEVADAIDVASRMTFGFAAVTIDGVLRCTDDGKEPNPLDATWREKQGCVLLAGKSRIKIVNNPTDWGVFDTRIEIGG